MAKRTRQDPLKPRKAPKVTEEKIAAHNQAENDCFTRTFGEQRAEEIGILAGQMDARIIETSSKTHEYLQRVTTSTLKGHALDTNDNESWAVLYN